VFNINELLDEVLEVTVGQKNHVEASTVYDAVCKRAEERGRALQDDGYRPRFLLALHSTAFANEPRGKEQGKLALNKLLVQRGAEERKIGKLFFTNVKLLGRVDGRL